MLWLDGRAPESGTHTRPIEDRVQAILAYLSDPEKARACAAMQEVETPDYCAADAPTSLGKTRGASVQPQRDMSDAAYLARHLRHERNEKKLRRQEKDALVRDRKRLIAQIASMEQVDVALLVPALAAREAERGAAPRDEDELLAHLGNLRTELVSDAKATLARYDKLLPDEAQRDAPSEFRASPVPKTRASPTPLVADPPVPRVVKERTCALGARASTPYTTPPRRVGPTLAELAHTPRDTSPTPPGSVYPPHAPKRRNSSRRKATSAFGERVPDYAAHREPFDTAMAHFLHGAKTPP